MRLYKYILLSAAAAAALAVAAAAAQAPAPSPLPPGEGREQLQRACSGCHAIDMVTQRRDTAAGWRQIVDTMVGRGAQLSSADMAVVVRYLAQNFPSGPAAASTPPAPGVSALPDGAAPRARADAGPPAAPPGLAAGSRAVTASASNSPSRRRGADWPSVNLDEGASRYSSLTQINVGNVGKLKQVWTYETDPSAPKVKTTIEQRVSTMAVGGGGPRLRTEITPLVIDGVMYITTPQGQAVALDGVTGKPIWKFTLASGQGRPTQRGLSYWRGDGKAPASIYFTTTSGLVVALDARTGQPIVGFGKEGVLDFGAVARGKFANLTPTVLSAPIFYKNIMITGMAGYGSGGKGPLGATRGWDAATGRLLWEFHGVPQPGEPGHETWTGNSWIDRDGAYNWGLQSLDVETGTVFVPLSTVHYDYYGGDRPGDNLYGSSVVALDANTGKLKWYFQTTHHDVWDADNHQAPVLVDVRQGPEKIPAVVLTTKRGYMFFLDRRTGKPVHPVEERRVPTDGFVSTELPSATQPFPVRPGPLARDYFTVGELSRMTPEHAAFCENMLKNGRSEPSVPAGPNGLRVGGPYLPYDENGSILFPWTNGGGEWEGMSYDPALGYVYVLTADLGEVFQAIPGASPPRITRYQFRNPNTGWPCSNGPYGEMVAVNVNTGLVAWRRPIGEDPRLIKMGIKDWGTLLMGGPTSTAGGVTFAGGTIDGILRAVDSATGKDLWQADVGAAAHSMTVSYLGRDGRQYIANFVSGGGFLNDLTISPTVRVFALPK